MTNTSEAAAVVAFAPAGLDLHHEVSQFLFREARLLDEELYRDWLSLLDPDIDYWAPGIQSRFRADRNAAPSRARMSHFRESLRDLEVRIRRFESPSAWAEDPPTRFCHAVSNIEVEVSGSSDLVRARSVLTLHRNRNEAEETQLVGRREDLLRSVDGEWRLWRRTVVLLQSVLLHKNINTFL